MATTEALSPEAMASSLAREREKNLELVQVQEKLRRELNKARFMAGNLRTELQNAQTVISSSKDAEQHQILSQENTSLKLQLETLKEAIRLSSPGTSSTTPPSISPSSSHGVTDAPASSTSSSSIDGFSDTPAESPIPASPAGSIEAASDSRGTAASFSEGVKRAYVEIDRLERLLEERTTELNRWKSKAQEGSSAHERDLAGLWEQLAKKEEELTALKEKHKKAYSNSESVVQDWSKKCQKLQSELSRLTSESDGMQGRFVQLEKENFTMAEQLSVATAMRASTEATSAMVSEKLEKTLDELAATKDKLRAATRGKTEAVRELEEARTKAEEIHSELARLQVAVEEKESALDIDRARLKELESLQVQLSEEKRLRAEETEKLSGELEEKEGELRALGEEARDLKQRLLEGDDELSKAKAVITNVTLEAKVANRRNVNIIKDLKAQLKREAAKYDQAQVDMTRLEKALQLQAEAMLESAGLPEAPSSPSSSSSRGEQQQQEAKNMPPSPTAVNNAGGANKLFDWGATTLSPLIQGLANQPKPLQVMNFAPIITTPRSLDGPVTEDEASLCSALAKRLETLLAENEKVRERVAFCEKTIRLLQADVDRKKVLLRHLTGSVRGEEESVTVEMIIEAAEKEGIPEGEGSRLTLEVIVENLYRERERLRRDLRMLGDELSAIKRTRTASSEGGDIVDDDSSMSGSGAAAMLDNSG